MDNEKELRSEISDLKSKIVSLEDELSKITCENSSLQKECDNAVTEAIILRTELEAFKYHLSEEEKLTENLGYVVDFYYEKSNRKPYKY